MIDEVKNFDMEVFIAFQRVIHEDVTLKKIEDCSLVFDGIEEIFNLT